MNSTGIMLRDMRSPRSVWAFLSLLIALPVCGQNKPAENSATETAASNAIQEMMRKVHQGGDKPKEQDLAARQEAGREIAKRGRQFLKDYPSSDKADDARAFASIGLYEATVAGDAEAQKELKDFAAETLKDHKVPEQM